MSFSRRDFVFGTLAAITGNSTQRTASPGNNQHPYYELRRDPDNIKPYHSVSIDLYESKPERVVFTAGKEISHDVENALTHGAWNPLGFVEGPFGRSKGTIIIRQRATLLPNQKVRITVETDKGQEFHGETTYDHLNKRYND